MKIAKVKESTMYYPLQGGEDLLTPPITVNPGRLLFSQNYECDLNARYRGIDGYEVFDGQPKPSDASYWIIDTITSGSFTVNATLTGATSSATGVILASVNDGTDDYVVLTQVSGTFQDGENLQIAGVTVAVADSIANEAQAKTETLHDTYLHAAIEYARSNIAAVPGSGNILGVWQYNGVKYAFRNNSGGTACVMYKSSASGWTACDLGRTVDFTNGGTYEIAEDDVITGAVSGATATVKRVIVESGSWAGSDAAGRLIIYSQSGTFQSENLNVGAHTTVATIGGNSTAHSLSPSGRFDFVNYNFYGHAGSRRMYGCDGVNKAFEWDGSTFVPIETGMSVDKPTHIKAYKYQLFLTFTGGSLQHSSLGDPYTWSPVTGASELGIGDEITNLEVLPGPVLAVQSRNSTHLLYGSGVADWDLKPYTTEAGCIEWSGQFMGTGIYLDDRGLTTIDSTQKYGDYVSNVISKFIQPYLKEKIGNVQCSMIVRDKGQYRLFFDDMEGITLTIDGTKILGFTRMLYDVYPVCCCSSENSSGEEELFFGASDGFVYQLDSGTSFNGNAIKRILRTHYNHLKSPSNYKRIRKLVLEMDAPVGTELQMYIDFSYGDDLESESQEFDVTAFGGMWNLVDWGDFVWDGLTVGMAEAYIEGTGTNYSLLVYSSSTYVEPHTLHGITVHYTVRGIRR